MISEIQKDLFAIKADAYAHGVNAAGIMGAGIAKTFRSHYPTMFEKYRAMCREGTLNPGDVFFYETRSAKPSVANIVTQADLSTARIEYLEQGLDKVLASYKDWGIQSLALPQIGCGLGGLLWHDVHALLNKKFENSDLSVIVSLPKQLALPLKLQ